MVTAIDMDNTLENKREMQVMGQTVTEVTEEQAHEAWKNARPCQCAQGDAMTIRLNCKTTECEDCPERKTLIEAKDGDKYGRRWLHCECAMADGVDTESEGEE